MKKLHLLFAGAFAALAVVACSDDEIESGTEYDETWYAANATISSSDSRFSLTEEGDGEISFKTEGGSVVVNVDCGTAWTAENSASDIFGCSVQSAGITVTAEQNLEEEGLNGTITLMTSESKIRFATISITQNAYGAPEITVTANEWHVPAVAATAEELTTEIGVEANDEWSVVCNAEWLKAEKGTDSVNLTATENETFEERVAEVVLTCTDGNNSDTETITVTQDARAYIYLGEEHLRLGKATGEATVTVDANYDWSCEYESDWFTVVADTNAGTLTVTCDANDTEDDRKGTVTVTAGDGGANVTEATLTITQSIYNAKDLVLEYTIETDGTDIELPLGERDWDDNKFATDCTVDWGDGSEVEEVTSGFPSHRYSTAGTYNVIINGTVEELSSFNYDKIEKVGGITNIGWFVSGVECLTAVKQWGDTGLKSLEYAFWRCKNLSSLPEEAGSFSNVTSFYSAFCECESLTAIPENMFSDCTAAVDFGWAFDSCTSLTSIPENLFANCPSVEYFEGVFEVCTSLTSVPEKLFANCPSVKYFHDAFWSCPSLTTIPENLFANCPVVVWFDGVFYGCTSLTSVPENIFAKCPVVESLGGVFYGCTSLTSVPENIFANSPLVEDFEYAFAECTSLTTVPENLFANCPSVENFEGVFGLCASLETVPVGIFNNNKLVTNFGWAFYYCPKLVGESPYTEIEGNNVHLYERENYPDYFTVPTYYEECFTGCTGLDDYYSIPSTWGGNGSSPTSVTPQSLNAPSPEGFGPSRLSPHRDAARSHLLRK